MKQPTTEVERSLPRPSTPPRHPRDSPEPQRHLAPSAGQF